MKNKIIQRMNCDEKQAEKLEKKLSAVDPVLKPILNNWLENGIEENDQDFNGYSINTLMKNRSLTFTGALLTLDWLMREPELATKAIKEGIK